MLALHLRDKVAQLFGHEPCDLALDRCHGRQMIWASESGCNLFGFQPGPFGAREDFALGIRYDEAAPGTFREKESTFGQCRSEYLERVGLLPRITEHLRDYPRVDVETLRALPFVEREIERALAACMFHPVG